MHVVVCVKQVPDTTNVRINPKTNTLMREGVESIVNPFDEYALEQGLLLKDRHGARLTVISMGPPQATAVLREALARGADEAFLVSSRAFGGADTLATSYTLSQAIRTACGGVPDIVLFGKLKICLSASEHFSPIRIRICSIVPASNVRFMRTLVDCVAINKWIP